MSAVVTGIRLMVFVHRETNGSLLWVSSTRPDAADISEGDTVTRQDVWIADDHNIEATTP